MPKPDVYLIVGTPPKPQHSPLQRSPPTRGKVQFITDSAGLYLQSSQKRVLGGIFHHQHPGWAKKRFQRLTLEPPGRDQHWLKLGHSVPGSAVDITQRGATHSPRAPQPKGRWSASCDCLIHKPTPHSPITAASNPVNRASASAPPRTTPYRLLLCQVCSQVYEWWEEESEQSDDVARKLFGALSVLRNVNNTMKRHRGYVSCFNNNKFITWQEATLLCKPILLNHSPSFFFSSFNMNTFCNLYVKDLRRDMFWTTLADFTGQKNMKHAETAPY